MIAYWTVTINRLRTYAEWRDDDQFSFAELHEINADSTITWEQYE